jgi:hypothetical protein
MNCSTPPIRKDLSIRNNPDVSAYPVRDRVAWKRNTEDFLLRRSSFFYKIGKLTDRGVQCAVFPYFIFY